LARRLLRARARGDGTGRKRGAKINWPSVCLSPAAGSHGNGLRQDGEGDGCLYLDRLPAPHEAGVIREALGIKRKRQLSAEAKVSLVQRLSGKPTASPSDRPRIGPKPCGLMMVLRCSFALVREPKSVRADNLRVRLSQKADKSLHCRK
jgi:hypothetical protein